MPSLRGVLENLIAVAILAAAAWLIARLDVSVPLWVVFLAVVVVGLAAFRGGRNIPRAEDLAAYHADHLGDAILTLREILAGKLPSVSFEEFIERGVLGPARFGLSRVPDEEIRLSVLELDKDSQEFRMLYEAGHGVGRKQNFKLGMTSLAGHAYRSRKLEWTNDVDSDKRWTAHSKARPDRAYGSLAAMPIVVGDDVAAILNVLSTEKGAFFKGDLTYIELLGTLIGLAWTMRYDAGTASTLPPSQESGDSGRKDE